jgi:hypothetical protein
MKKNYLLWVAIFATLFSYAQTEVFINEIHYDNIGGDVNEGVEIVGPAGTDLTGWRLVFYNGSDGAFLNTQSLAGIIPNEQNNRGVIWFAHATIIQNDMEGIALIDPLDKVIQFLSYEGSFVATDGLAVGITSVDIGVVESDITTSLGNSLQLTGSGTDYEDFIWVAPDFATNNLKNNGQTFISSPFILATYIVEGLDYLTGLGPSGEGIFTVSGTNLTNDIVLTAPTNFEISETSGGSFSVSITLLKGVGTTIAPTTIYVRLKAGLSISNYTQEGLISSVGSVDKNISLNGIVSPNSGSIIITEIMQDPDIISDANGEYFEVYNTTGSAIDMNGWVISDNGSESHSINSSVIVPSEGYAVLARNSDIGANGGFTANYEFSGFTLGNSSDEIILTSGGTEIDRVEYNSTTFPYFAGKSMELHLYEYNNISNNTGSNWGAAITAYGSGDLGTPGTNNDFGLSVVKNEIPNFIMYPNPVSNGSLYLSSANRVSKRIQIYTLNGQQVYNKNLQFEENVNISNLKKGIYLVKIEEGGKIATRKLIVN